MKRTYYITRTDDYIGLKYEAREQPYRDIAGQHMDVIATVRASSRQEAIDLADSEIEKDARLPHDAI